MCIRRFALPLLAAGLVGLSGGCGKSGTEKQAPAEAVHPVAQKPSATSSPDQTLAKLHWLGKKRLAADTNAAGLMAIWNQPESARLEAQTLDKLALGLAHARDGRIAASTVPVTNYQALLATNAIAPKLRPLLEDLLQEECYFEARQTTNEFVELALAVRLTPERASIWSTNLGSALESLTGSVRQPAEGRSSGWSLSFTNRTSRTAKAVVFTRSSDWTLVGFGTGTGNALLADFASRAERDHAPLASGATSFWLETDFDLKRILAFSGVAVRGADLLPNVHVEATGDGANVKTHGSLSFPAPLNLNLPRWRIPTNVIRGPLIGFSAARGLGTFLKASKAINPRSPFMAEQAYLWDRDGVPFDMFFALKIRDAHTTFVDVSSNLYALVNPLLGRDYGSITPDPEPDSLSWKGLGHAAPFVQVTTNAGDAFLFGGFAPFVARAITIAPELLQHVLDSTNLVYFDWEITGKRVVHWRYLDDVYRITFDTHGPRLLLEYPSLQWIKRNLDTLSHSVTEIKVTGASNLTFARKSTVGFTGIELDLIANWLELPEFPSGLATLLATNAAPVPDLRHIH